MSADAGPWTQKQRANKFIWNLRLRQFAAITRLEIRKNFLGLRAILLYLIALAPVLLMAVFAIGVAVNSHMQPGELNIIFANIYELLILRTSVFFGCAWMFMNLFRGEVVDKSLHYYFLAPVRREVVLAGKYASGFLASAILFGATTLGCIFFVYEVPRLVNTNLSPELGTGTALGYLGITVLGCVGYGAVFLIIGLFFRNPIIPALVMYGWETINFLLPPVLKKISVVHYLESLKPVRLSEGPFAIVADPTPVWLSITGLLVFSLLLLVFAGLRIRRLEIKYLGE